MNPFAELDQLNLEPAAKIQVAALFQALIDQQVKAAQLVHAKDVKIAALTHELAYYKRIRFSTKSEALAPLQRDVFEETWNTDISAIEAEARAMTVEERKHLRCEKSLPALAAMHDWLQQTRLRTAPNSATIKAIDYSLKRWAALTRYAETGDLSIGRVEMQRGGLSFRLSDPPLSFGGASLAKA